MRLINPTLYPKLPVCNKKITSNMKTNKTDNKLLKIRNWPTLQAASITMLLYTATLSLRAAHRHKLFMVSGKHVTHPYNVLLH